MSVTKVTGMMQTGTKGGDIPSASTLVIDTDGDYFDITGTTGITAMTVDAGRRFTLQFDGAVTLTHGSSLYLPGATSFTTEANDCLSFIATAANTVRCTGYALKDGGSPVAGSTGPHSVIASGSVNSNTLDITSITQDFHIEIRFKDSYTTDMWGNGSMMYLSTDNGSSWLSSNYRFAHGKSMTSGASGILASSTGASAGRIFEHTGARSYKLTVQGIVSSAVRTNVYGIASHSASGTADTGVITTYCDHSTAATHNAIRFEFSGVSPTADFDYVIYKI